MSIQDKEKARIIDADDDEEDEQPDVSSVQL
jgi:hypothetical protein